MQGLLRGASFRLPVRVRLAAAVCGGRLPLVLDRGGRLRDGGRPVAVTRALLAVQPADINPPRAPANGPMWRLRSLIAMGHATGRITTALAAPAHVIEPLIRGDRATITTTLAGDIGRLFEAWWDKQPPQHTPAEKAAASKARHRAARNNWPCPAALDEDDLDQPGYRPSARWRHALGSGIAAADPLGNNHHPHPPCRRSPVVRASERERDRLTRPA